jgi:cysteinyl-tRNA synthetase
MGGEKMSKSLGNLTFVDDLLQRHEPVAIRSFLLRRHYRHDFEFVGDELEHSASESIAMPAEGARRELRQADLRPQFYRALDTDLDTPAAMRCLDRAAASDRAEDRAFLEEGRHLLGLDL